MQFTRNGSDAPQLVVGREFVERLRLDWPYEGLYTPMARRTVARLSKSVDCPERHPAKNRGVKLLLLFSAKPRGLYR